MRRFRATGSRNLRHAVRSISSHDWIEYNDTRTFGNALVPNFTPDQFYGTGTSGSIGNMDDGSGTAGIVSDSDVTVGDTGVTNNGPGVATTGFCKGSIGGVLKTCGDEVATRGFTLAKGALGVAKRGGLIPTRGGATVVNGGFGVARTGFCVANREVAGVVSGGVRVVTRGEVLTGGVFALVPWPCACHVTAASTTHHNDTN